MIWDTGCAEPGLKKKNDYKVRYRRAEMIGCADGRFKNMLVQGDRPIPEDGLREMNRGCWSTGYCGQSPERLKAHMRNQDKFDLVTLRAPKDDPEVGGDYYGLPWPCWGKPAIRHPGTANLYDTSLHVMDGGSPFRRSDERRVGQEGVSTCRSRGWPS